MIDLQHECPKLLTFSVVTSADFDMYFLIVLIWSRRSCSLALQIYFTDRIRPVQNVSDWYYSCWLICNMNTPHLLTSYIFFTYKYWFRCVYYSLFSFQAISDFYAVLVMFTLNLILLLIYISLYFRIKLVTNKRDISVR